MRTRSTSNINRPTSKTELGTTSKIVQLNHKSKETQFRANFSSHSQISHKFSLAILQMLSKMPEHLMDHLCEIFDYPNFGKQFSSKKRNLFQIQQLFWLNILITSIDHNRNPSDIERISPF